MHISTAFPSTYLKAADLQGRTVRVIMDKVVMEEIGSGEQKPILYFVGKERGLVLNKTNATNISLMHGDDTDAWQGKEMVLFTAFVDFQGKTVPAIRIRPVMPQDGVAKPAPAPVAPPPLDDNIPFK